jgi:hypothetical protein
METILPYICERCAGYQIGGNCQNYGWDLVNCVGSLLVVLFFSIVSFIQGCRGFFADVKFYKAQNWDFSIDSGLLFGKKKPLGKVWTSTGGHFLGTPVIRLFLGYPALIISGIALTIVFFF